LKSGVRESDQKMRIDSITKLIYEYFLKNNNNLIITGDINEDLFNKNEENKH